MKEWIINIFLEDLEMYELIRDNKKKIDSRAPDPSKPEKSYQSIAPGDIIIFRVSNRNTLELIEKYPPLKFVVKYNKHYDSAEELLLKDGLDNIFPNVNSIEEALEIYYSFPGYTERIEKYGICAIGLGERIS